eukprot:jgi/Mesvir1/574/Mv02020-RA.1
MTLIKSFVPLCVGITSRIAYPPREIASRPHRKAALSLFLTSMEEGTRLPVRITGGSEGVPDIKIPEIVRPSKKGPGRRQNAEALVRTEHVLKGGLASAPDEFAERKLQTVMQRHADMLAGGPALSTDGSTPVLAGVQVISLATPSSRPASGIPILGASGGEPPPELTPFVAGASASSSVRLEWVQVLPGGAGSKPAAAKPVAMTAGSRAGLSVGGTVRTVTQGYLASGTAEGIKSMASARLEGAVGTQALSTSGGKQAAVVGMEAARRQEASVGPAVGEECDLQAASSSMSVSEAHMSVGLSGMASREGDEGAIGAESAGQDMAMRGMEGDEGMRAGGGEAARGKGRERERDKKKDGKERREGDGGNKPRERPNCFLSLRMTSPEVTRVFKQTKMFRLGSCIQRDWSTYSLQSLFL